MLLLGKLAIDSLIFYVLNQVRYGLGLFKFGYSKHLLGPARGCPILNHPFYYRYPDKVSDLKRAPVLRGLRAVAAIKAS